MAEERETPSFGESEGGTHPVAEERETSLGE